MSDYLKLMRVKHYIKNFLIFIPLFFSGNIFNTDKLLSAFLGFICFCLISSAVYVLNDIQDVEKDRKHQTKRNRPIASGRINEKKALIIMTICLLFAVSVSLIIGQYIALSMTVIYFLINVAYSMGLKNRPIVDIIILAAGFVLRLLYGGVVTETIISGWLYLVVVSGSLYMGLGKRRNELKRESGETRGVLKYYTTGFLDKNMYVCVALTNVFYALWTMELSDKRVIWTVPLFIVIMMCYSLQIEGDSDGDPVEVILKDKLMLSLVVIYAISIFSLLYVL